MPYNRLRQSAIFVSVKVAKFEIKGFFSVYLIPYYIKQIDSRSASCATFLFLPHFDVLCDLLLNRRMATWNLFVKYTIIYKYGKRTRQLKRKITRQHRIKRELKNGKLSHYGI